MTILMFFKNSLDTRDQKKRSSFSKTVPSVMSQRALPHPPRMALATQSTPYITPFKRTGGGGRHHHTYPVRYKL